MPVARLTVEFYVSTMQPAPPQLDQKELESASTFRTPYYIRHNQRRQEHLSSLGLDIAGRSVLELGAGIGDHTGFFLDRNCSVLSAEPRNGNFKIMQFNLSGHPRSRVVCCDVESMDRKISETFDIVYAYGLLYHLSDPGAALAAMARRCTDLLLLETCVSFGSEEAINLESEKQSSATQAFEGIGCRPTRPWIFNNLKKLFPYVYVPTTQPAHNEFPLDWRATPTPNSYHRAVFIASRRSLSNPLLLDHLPDQQSIS